MPGFVASSKLLKKYEQDKAYRLHKQKISQVKPTVDVKPPKRYPHVILRMKRIQQEEERQAEVDHENKVLLQKMTQIMKNRPELDNWNEYEPRSLHAGQRERETQEIHMENIGIARRLERANPVIKTKELEKDYQKKRYIQALWAENMKDFVEVTPRHLKYRQLKKHREGIEEEYDEDYEDENDPNHRHKVINRDSLPPIDDGKQNIRYMKEEGSASPYRSYKREKLPKIALDKKSDDESIYTDRSDRSYQKTGPQQVQMDSDAKQLFNACKLIGKVHPEDIMIRTLVRRTRQQRLQTKARFTQLYELELIPELKSGLGPDWHLLIDALLDERISSVSRTVNDALEEGNYVTVVEVFCTSEPTALAKLDESYKKDYAVSLDSDISEKTDGPERTLLLALRKGRDESVKVNDRQVEADADALYGSGDGRWSSESGPFIKMLNAKNFAHMRAVLNMYRVLTGGKDATEDIKSECTRQYADACIATIRCIQGADVYFADKIFKTMSPKDPEFINLIVARSEVDMPAIKRAYKKKYDAELVDDLKHKCHHNSVNVLIEIINKVPQGQGKKKKPPVPHGPVKRPAPKKQEQQDVVGNNPLSQPSKRMNADIASKRKADGQTTDRDKEREKEKKKEKEYTRKNISGTVMPYKNFHPDEDCKILNAALKDGRLHEVIDIIPCRCNGQRQHLKKVYYAKFRQELVSDLESELRGDFEEIVLALMTSPCEYDAYCLHEAMDGLGTTEATLVGILTTRDLQDKKVIAELFKNRYKEDLADALRSDTSGAFLDLLLALLKSERDQTATVDMKIAKHDAKQLYKDGDLSIDVKDDVFVNLLVKKNHAQVKATFKEYEKLAGHDIYTGLTKASLEDMEDGYITLVKAIEDPIEFYAERLNSCFSGIGTNDNMLIRIIVTRSEIDLGEIKERYKKLYKKSLRQSVESECSGDYKDMLLAVIGD